MPGIRAMKSRISPFIVKPKMIWTPWKHTKININKNTCIDAGQHNIIQFLHQTSRGKR